MKKSKIFIITMLMLLVAMCIAPITVFATTEIGEANIGSVNFDYVAGDAPKASAHITYDEAGNYDNYEIEYEYWEEMETNENGESNPVKFWYSDENKNNALSQDKKITTFEEGKTYMYSISLKAKDGYSFKDGCTVKINDETVKKENVIKNSSGVYVTAIKTIKPISKKVVELVEINGVMTKFNVGDVPKFTGKVADNALYEIDNEGWAGADEIITSSEYWNNRYKDWGDTLLTSFKENTKYSYNIYVKLTDEAVKNGYYFDKDKTKISINGKTITMNPDSVSISESNNVVAWFYGVLTMTPTSTEQPTQDTVKEIKSTGAINGSITFEKEVSKNYTLDIKKVEVSKNLSDKNIKYLADINVLENGQVVKIDNTKMKIKIALPEDLKGYKKYEVVYILNDEIKETIPATVEDGYIVFETSHLSQYGIVATNVEEKTEQVKNETNNPKTGDNITTSVILFVASISTIGTLIIINRKKVRE